MVPTRTHTVPTFQRGSQRTTIDYIFITPMLRTKVNNFQQQFLPSAWTDHALLTVDIQVAKVDIGPGVWRFNPTLLSQPSFQKLLLTALDMFFLKPDNQCPVTQQWDKLKDMIKWLTTDFAKRYHSGCRNQLRLLQQQRAALLQQGELDAHHREDLIAVESRISALIQDQTEQLLLRT
ncbi:hypothetical protein EC973_008561, partial [Apophysomyces ossiformis]